jgi:hypothetical protein
MQLLSPAFPPPDPLRDHFAIEQLPAIAPWIAEQIQAIGRDRIFATIAAAGDDPDEALPMSTWVAAIQHYTSPISDALAS